MSEKAEPKTILELIALHDAWKRTFHRGAMGNRNDYNLARDTRHHFEEELWIPAKGLVATIKDRIKDLGDKYKAILVDGKTITTEELVLQAGIKAYEEFLVLLGVEEIVESVELDYSDFPEGKEVTVLKLKEKKNP